jgi:hypothetical protein
MKKGIGGGKKSGVEERRTKDKAGKREMEGRTAAEKDKTGRRNTETGERTISFDDGGFISLHSKHHGECASKSRQALVSG